MSDETALRPSYRELLAPSRRALVLGGLGASFLASFDLLLVVTALPSAARDLGGINGFAFAAAAYAVAQVTGQPIGGRSPIAPVPGGRCSWARPRSPSGR